MTFFRSIFRNRDAERNDIRRFVDMEYRPADREQEFNRLLRQSGL